MNLIARGAIFLNAALAIADCYRIHLKSARPGLTIRLQYKVDSVNRDYNKRHTLYYFVNFEFYRAFSGSDLICYVHIIRLKC